MIYIFQCPKQVCEACGQGCEACAPKCKACCEPCLACFDDCGNSCNDFLNRPLGGYVLMALWLATLEAGFCGYALYKEAVPGAVNLDSQINQVDGFLGANVTSATQAPKVAGAPRALFKDCNLTDSIGEEVGIKMWIYVQIGCAIVHFLFAPYLQCKLLVQLRKTSQSDPAAQTPSPGLQVASAAVKDSFKHVFLYDFGVLFYVIILIFSYWWSNKGTEWAQSDPLHCDPGATANHSGWITKSAAFGIFFFWFVFLYAIGWWCYINCMSEGEGLTLLSGPPAHYKTPAAASAAKEGAAAPPKQGLMGAASAFARPVSTQPDTAEQPKDPGCCARTFNPKQLLKLLACIGLDFMGNATYLLPAMGEVGDAAWAPAQAVMLKMLFDANGVAVIGLIEELLPFTDICPTATVAWCLETWAPEHPITRALGLSPPWVTPPPS